MVSSVSGQDEPNHTRWLATRAGKMGLSCPLWDYPLCPARKISPKLNNKSFIDQAFLAKMAGCWPCSFLASLWTSSQSRSINMQKRTWPISSHLDQKSLVNNPYLLVPSCLLDWGVHVVSHFSVDITKRQLILEPLAMDSCML